MRSATVYANGLRVGRHVGYVSPVEMELPCTPQQLDLKVEVDSSWNITEDPLYGSGSWDTSFGGFGGIVGHAKILFRMPAWIEDSVNVQSIPLDAHGSWQSTFSVSVVGNNTLDGAGHAMQLRVLVCEDVPSGGGPACVGGGAASTLAAVTTGMRVSLDVTIPNAKLWLPGTRKARANLYTANFTLVSSSDGSVIASRSIRYGIKRVELVGKTILFNGERLYLRGYVRVIIMAQPRTHRTAPHRTAPHRTHARTISST